MASASAHTITVLTYNVHGCRGGDGVLDPARIAEVIARSEADIIGLQELDVGRKRSGGIDQARAIAAHLNMMAHFHPAMHARGEKYGDAILTHFPSRLIKAGAIPSVGEPRGALMAAIDLGPAEIVVANTHLGLWRRERIAQTSVLMGPTWLGHPEVRGRPTIFMGDFNAVPRSTPYRRIVGELRDVQHARGGPAKATFPARFPLLRLDHIFVSSDIEVAEARVVADQMARRASDHLPLMARLTLTPAEPEMAETPSTTSEPAGRLDR